MTEEEKIYKGLDEESSTDVAKCPACGANMIFSPEDGCLKCEYCGEKLAIDVDKSSEIDFEELLKSHNEWGEETHVFRCENCGAKEIVSKSDIAKSCPFCGATHVVETEELSGLRPNAVVPFAIGKETAIDKFKAWIKKRPFVPRKFKKFAALDNVRGMYTPAFSFDTQTESWYQGVLGKYYYETRRVAGRTERRRRIRFFPISGSFDMFFDDVLIQASEKPDENVVSKLQPFGTNDSCEYTEEFMHGFTATRYERDGLECWGKAKLLIDKHLKKSILARYDYDVLQSFSVKTSYKEMTYKYLLLPIYVGRCDWGKKAYNFYINGHNGKVAGKLPVSPLRVGLLILGSLAIICGVAALVYFTGGL